jgi:hypothetical protein
VVQGGSIRCWRVGSRSELSCFPPFHQGAVVSLAMSLDGSALVSVGLGPIGQVVALWKDAHGSSEWTKPCVVGSALCGHARVLFTVFDTSEPDQLCFVTGNANGELIRWATNSTGLALSGTRVTEARDATRHAYSIGDEENVVVGAHCCGVALHSTGNNCSQHATNIQNNMDMAQGKV